MKKHYVYRITNILLKLYYYGTRSTNLNPKDDLGTKYFSSSSNKEFIKDQKENPQNYKYKVIKMFDTRKEAMDLEIKLHDKFNVGINEKFYNRSKQTSTKFDTSGTSHLSNKERKKRSEKWKNDNPNNYRDSSGENNPMYGSARFGELNPFYGKSHSKKTKDKLSKSMEGKSHPQTLETRAKISKTKRENPYIITNKTREKIKLGLANRPILICPHCNLQSKSNSNMNRYHFDKCKSLK